MNAENNNFLIHVDKATEILSKELICVYNKISEVSNKIPAEFLNDNIVDQFGKNRVSVINVLSYLLGWANMLISWYEMGKQNEIFIMPGEGFSKWDYEKISQHFYKKYGNHSLEQQLLFLGRATCKIISIVDIESRSGNIDRLGAWDWCTLKSGKRWPLKKWIVVNSLSPYKRALSKLRITLKNLLIQRQ